VEWQLDAAHSNVGFTARHIVSKATGQFKKFSAVIKADPKTAKLSSLEATVETASIDTGIEKRDAHLKGDDFFNSEKYPQLKLSAKSFKWNGNKFTATTDLTIRDVTKPVTFKGELIGVHAANFGQGAHQRAGYEATATVNRKDFGLKWAMVTEGLAVVGDNVDININVELMYTPPAATTAAAPAAPTAAPAATTAAATPAKPATAPAAPAATPAPKQPTASAPHTAAKPAAAPAKPAQQAAAQPQAH
jgi:polyisoprenoid-binding protein YceI